MNNFIVDPSKITNYNLNKYQLEVYALFWLLVAGKTARVTSRLLDNFLRFLHKKYNISQFRPFDVIRRYDAEYPDGLEDLLRNFGFGCQKAKAKGIRQLIYKDIDLRTCTVDELETIHCIGQKTSRCFVIHTRPNVRHAGLDTHVLKWLRSLGHDVPQGTPRGPLYIKIENIFLRLADKLRMNPAKLDLMVWNAYSTNSELKLEI